MMKIMMILIFLGFVQLKICSEFNKQLNQQVYMDEYFHYNQTVEWYMKQNYQYYNEKITTLPGLYMVAMVILKMFQVEEISINYLRIINAVIILPSLFGLLYKMTNLKTALTILLLPTSYFFSFLYYTDVISLFFILLTKYLHETKSNKLLILLTSIMAVLCRQTNIIWILYITGSSLVLDDYENNQDLFGFVKFLIINSIQITKKYIHFITVLFLFIGGVILNHGSIVLGDVDNHKVNFHFAQLLYFFSFLFVFTFNPRNISQYFNEIKKFNVWGLFLIISAVIGIVKYFTIVHPFILSDNRHYTFYVWSKFFNKHQMTYYLPIPFYVLSIMLIFSNNRTLQFLIYLIAIITSIATLPLIEPRYFTVAYVIYYLDFGSKQFNPQLLLMNIIINAITIYIFLYKPFRNPSFNDELSRFMW